MKPRPIKFVTEARSPLGFEIEDRSKEKEAAFATERTRVIDGQIAHFRTLLASPKATLDDWELMRRCIPKGRQHEVTGKTNV
jgi:hypothetical protein